MSVHGVMCSAVADPEILKGGFHWYYVDPRCRGLGAQPPDVE